MVPAIYQISGFISVDFTKSDIFHEIWQISLITISLQKQYEILQFEGEQVISKFI